MFPTTKFPFDYVSRERTIKRVKYVLKKEGWVFPRPTPGGGTGRFGNRTQTIADIYDSSSINFASWKPTIFPLRVGEKLLVREEAKFIFIQNNSHPFGVSCGKHGQLRKERRKEGRRRRKDESDAKDRRNPKMLPVLFHPFQSRLSSLFLVQSLKIPCGGSIFRNELIEATTRNFLSSIVARCKRYKDRLVQTFCAHRNNVIRGIILFPFQNDISSEGKYVFDAVCFVSSFFTFVTARNGKERLLLSANRNLKKHGETPGNNWQLFRETWNIDKTFHIVTSKDAAFVQRRFDKDYRERTNVTQLASLWKDLSICIEMYMLSIDSRENKRHSSFVSIFRLLVELCVIFWRDTLHGNWLSDINLRQPAYREYYAVDIEILAGSMIACFRWSSGVNIASRGSFVIENGIKRSPRRSYSRRWLQSLIEKINEPVEPTRFVFVPRDRFNAPLS